MTIRRALARLSLLLAVSSLSLDAFAKSPNAIETAPVLDGPTQVEFSTEQVSKWTDLPLGTYRVPNSDVIISGHEKGGAAPMLLFGVIGLAVQSGINSHNGHEAAAAAEKVLTFSIDEEAKAKLQAALANPDYAGKFTSEATGNRRFEVTGAVVMSFANKQEVLPYVTLRVKLLEGTSKQWTTRYIASSGARHPLAGEGSWTENDGALLKPQVSKLLDLAINTMLKDMANPYPRDEATLTNVHGFFVHVNKPLQVVGYKLAEHDGQMIFLPRLSTTIVFAGVNILDASTVWQQPAVKKDAPLKLLKVTDPTLAGLVTPADAAAPAATASADASTEAPATDAAPAAGEEAPAGATEGAPGSN